MTVTQSGYSGLTNVTKISRGAVGDNYFLGYAFNDGMLYRGDGLLLSRVNTFTKFSGNTLAMTSAGRLFYVAETGSSYPFEITFL